MATSPFAASADGLEFAGAGARGTMRGGAYAVGADDAMALLYNPANLAQVPDTQLHVSAGLLFYAMCFDRDGTYGASPGYTNRGGVSDVADAWGSGALDSSQETALSDGAGGTIAFDDVRGTALPEVCNSQRLNAVPELAVSVRLNDRIGLGFGLIAPTAVSHLRYGSTLDGRRGMVRVNGVALPAPSRYMQIEQQALMAFPTAGIGIDVTDDIRIGASFSWGIAPEIEFQTVATPFYSENFAYDAYGTVKVHDWFIPRVSVGMSAGPFTGWSFGGQFTYTGDIEASGTMHVETLYYYDPAVRDSLVTSVDVPVGLSTRSPWQLVLGARYADPRDDVTLPEGSVGDWLDTENWSIELNLGLTRSSRLRAYDVAIGNPPVPRNPDGSVDTAAYPCSLDDPNAATDQACLHLQPTLVAKLPPTFPAPIRHHWKDQITLRLGGDYNVVPGRFAVSGGFSFDSNGQQSGYEQLDFQPWRRVGLHTGLTVRVNRWDMFIAYAHHFNQTRRPNGLSACSGTRVPAADHNSDGDFLDSGEQESCDNPPPNGNQLDSSDSDWGVHSVAALGLHHSDVVNSGRYRSHLDVVQVGATYHFR